MKYSVLLILVCFYALSSCIGETGDAIVIPINNSGAETANSSGIPSEYDFGDFGGVTDVDETIAIQDTILVISRAVTLNMWDNTGAIDDVCSVYINDENGNVEQEVDQVTLKRIADGTFRKIIEVPNIGFNYIIVVPEQNEININADVTFALTLNGGTTYSFSREPGEALAFIIFTI